MNVERAVCEDILSLEINKVKLISELYGIKGSLRPL